MVAWNPWNACSELIEVVTALRNANDALLDATMSGEVVEATRLLQDVAVLERRRNRLVHKTNPGVAPVTSSYESSIPLRDQVIQALQLTGRPSSARLVSDVTKSRWAERVDTAKLSYLRRDEARSWRRSQELPGRHARDVYVVPALTYDRFTPVRGTVALSTWPISLRLIAPLSPRVDMLHSTVALAEEVSAVAGTNYEAPMMRLVARLGATIPGVKPFGADPHAVIEAARAELEEIEETDELERSQAAERASAQLDAEALLFGTQIHTIRSHVLVDHDDQHAGSARNLPRRLSCGSPSTPDVLPVRWRHRGASAVPRLMLRPSISTSSGA